MQFNHPKNPPSNGMPHAYSSWVPPVGPPIFNGFPPGFAPGPSAAPSSSISWPTPAPHTSNPPRPLPPPRMRTPQFLPPGLPVQVHQPGPAGMDSDWPALGAAGPITPSTSSSSRHTLRSSANTPSSSNVPTPSASSNPVSPASSYIPPSAGNQAIPSHGLDRFAPVYVPALLRQIATAHPKQVVKPVYKPNQDPEAYADGIFPKSLIEYIRKDLSGTESAFWSRHIINVDDLKLEKLDNSGEVIRYGAKLMAMQLAEFQQRTLDLAASTIYDTRVSIAIPDDSSKEYYKLEAPEIREGYPMLDINDVVFLRHIDRAGNGQPHWNGHEYIAEVVSIKRADGIIAIKCPALRRCFPTAANDSERRFIVSFEPQGRSFYAARSGAIRLDTQLHIAGSDRPERSLARRWLFPKPEDHKVQSAAELGLTMPISLRWRDRNLNAEQKRTIKSLVYKRRQVPFLVSGPPGTGKTKTIVEAVLQILAAYPDSGSILLCGASNPSTDTLATRLAAHLAPKEMLRLSDEGRPLDEVSGRLLPYCNILEGRFGIPDFQQLRQYKVIVTSALDASVLTRFSMTNDSLARLEHAHRTLWHSAAQPTSHYHFDYFILDEAAQLAELDLSPALSVVLPGHDLLASPDHKQRRIPQICLVGDHCQLGPFVSSSAARAVELDLSLLQRLFERPLYKDHPAARVNLKQRASILHPPQDEKEDHVSEDLDAPLCNLVKNYRSHVGLLMVPSAAFYHDTLEPMAAVEIQTTTLLNWPQIKGQDIPLLIKHVDGVEDAVNEGASWFNNAEVDNVVSTIQELVEGSASAPAVRPADISVISPFREQVWKIRMRLRAVKLGDVNVGRESDLQGAEYRVIIISSVRTSQRFVPDDRRRNRGFLLEPKRFNVAITRAKELMVIFGHIPTLYKADPFWRMLIQFAIRRGCYQGPTMSDFALSEHLAADVSRLEEAFDNKAVTNSDGDRQAEILAGGMARTVLRDLET